MKLSTTIDELYQSKESVFLKASDLARPASFVIKDVTVQTFRDARKLVLSFEGTPKKLPLNRTNVMKLRDLLGSDYTKWIKKTIRLETADTMFNGQKVKGLRIL